MNQRPLLARALRVAGVLAVAIAVSVAAVFLGRWQYHRYETRSAELHAFDAGQAAPAVPLGELVPSGVTQLPDAARWRDVTVTGRFEANTETWLRNRPVGGTPAVHALAWFVTDGGDALLVDAGWTDARTPARPGLPTTEQTLTVTLRPAEQDDGKRDAGATRINAAQMPDAPVTPLPGYGVLTEACGKPCGPVPGLTTTPLPTLGLGPHLSYAWQWWILAAASPFIAVSLLRRDARDEAHSRSGEPSGTAPPAGGPGPGSVARVGRHRREDRGPSDEEIEDAL